MGQKKKRPYIEYSFLVVVFLGAVIVAGLAALSHFKTQNLSSKTSAAPLSLPQLTASLSSKLQTDFPKLKLQKTYDQTLKIGYRFLGDKFEVLLPTSSASLTFVSKVTGGEAAAYNYFSSTQSTVNSFLSGQGFRAPEEQTPAGSLLTKVNFYASSSALCQVTAYTLLDINCAPLNELNMAEKSAKPFVKIYQTANIGAGESAVSLPVFINSQTPGYRLAEMYFYNDKGGTFANFYSKNGSPWHMVNQNWYETWGNNHLTAGGNTMRDCYSFDSSTATAAAFKGQTCYDTYLGRSSKID